MEANTVYKIDDRFVHMSRLLKDLMVGNIG